MVQDGRRLTTRFIEKTNMTIYTIYCTCTHSSAPMGRKCSAHHYCFLPYGTKRLPFLKPKVALWAIRRPASSQHPQCRRRSALPYFRPQSRPLLPEIRCRVPQQAASFSWNALRAEHCRYPHVRGRSFSFHASRGRRAPDGFRDAAERQASEQNCPRERVQFGKDSI